MSNTATNEDKYTIDGVEVTSAKVIEYFAAFLRKQAYRNGRLRARNAELELIIEELIDAGNELDYPLDDDSREHIEWRKIVTKWNKEHK